MLLCVGKSNKLVFRFKTLMLLVEIINCIFTRNTNKKTSLILLKKNALKLDLIVPLRVLQKLIKKNDDNPIDSQPRNNVNKLLANTKIIILNINQFIRSANISSCASYFK
jgi:hypothetical protein